MSSSETSSHGEIRVRSRFGPVRIEVLDDRLSRHALGFGELQANVPAGLYTLQYTAGTTRDEEIVRVSPGSAVVREIDLQFPSVAPITVSTTTHEFHRDAASRLSLSPTRVYGAGGGLMIFVRTIDGNGTAPVPTDRLLVLNSQLRSIANPLVDGTRDDRWGWAGVSDTVDPGGYALRWLTSAGQSDVGRSGPIEPVDQSLWVAHGWTTIVFIGYRAESDRLERQTASIYMARVGEPFQAGPELWQIREGSIQDDELREARVSQGLDLALSGLRTGNQVVPDDLLDLVLHAKFQNPMLGIVGAHAIIQRRVRDWVVFDEVVRNLEGLVPGHPDVAALRLCGSLLRDQAVPAQAIPIGWPPMVNEGYKALINSDWERTSGDLIADGSVAERAATTLLPESPWTYWAALEEPLEQRAPLKLATRALSDCIQIAVRAPTSSRAIGAPAGASGGPDHAVARVERYIARLRDAGDEVDSSKVSLDDFRHLGLPVSAVERAIRSLAAGGEPAAERLVARDTAPAKRRKGEAGRPAKPNILIIMGDDIGWFNVSMNNNGIMGYRTPNIDRIAKEGCNFTDWYGQQSCTAGRAAFITGQSPIRTGLTKVGLPGANLGLWPEDPTIADVLKPLGYVCGQFGKNHLGDRDEFLPTVHGFDEFFGNLYHLNAEQEPENPDYPKDPEFRKKFAPRGVLHSWASPDGSQRIEDTGPLTIKRMETVDEEFLDAGLKFMEKAVTDSKPFFCWWNSTRMHIFTHLKKESQGKTGLGVYPDGMVEHDGHVGQLLDKLDELGIADNTIVMYSTDNGAEVMSWPDGGSTPFRGEKDTNFEGGWRVPCAIRWPGVIKPGTVSNEIFSHTDILPTLAAAAGSPDAGERLKKGYQSGNRTFKVHIDGFNLLPFLKGEVTKNPREAFLYWSDDGDLMALRVGNWKITFMEQRARGLGVWEEPLVAKRVPDIYNLRSDPFERASQDATLFYGKWKVDRAFLLVPAQEIVGQFLATFKEFPPRQRPSSFSIDQALEKARQVNTTMAAKSG